MLTATHVVAERIHMHKFSAACVTAKNWSIVGYVSHCVTYRSLRTNAGGLKDAEIQGLRTKSSPKGAQTQQLKLC